MRILLDTHAFIWWDTDPARLSPRAFALCMDSGNQIVLSTASLWEMAIKAHLGKLRLTKSLAQIVADQQQANRLEILPVIPIHVLELETLPTVHKDPFDGSL